MPATFVIGTDGTIAYAAIDPDYHVRPEPAEVLAAIPAPP
jgi:peroxiredoxin